MIYGDRIRLRAIERNDLLRFVSWVNDPEVIEGLLIFPVISQGDEEAWYENIMKKPQVEHPMMIDIRMPSTNLGGDASTLNSRPPEVEWVPIGDCSFMSMDWISRSSEVGIMIGEKRFWNQGYGTEVMKLLVKFGFETLNLHRIWLRVFATNPRAIRSYEKAGFVHEGRLREAQFKSGKYADVLLLSILENERNYAFASHTS